MNKIFKRRWIIFLLLAQAASAQEKLAGYIQVGLQNNESIKQQQFYLDRSLYALKEARSLFLPSIGLNASYTLADGGRAVDLPIGDLLNGAYATLNHLTASNKFPQVQNQSIALNPNNFYNLNLHTTFPIINAELTYNRKIKSQQIDLQATEVNIYKRELAKEIKLAYFNYLQAFEAAKIYENALKLVQENARINTALFNNQKINRTAVIRSNNEVTKVSAQINTANQQLNNAKAYFNFLLNRPLDTDIEMDIISNVPGNEIMHDTSVGKREELQKLNTAKEINKNLIGLANSYRKPKLNSFLDLGSQGFDFNVNSKAPYYFVGLSLEWNIFSPWKYKYKAKQVESDQQALESQTSYVQQQLALQVRLAMNSFSASVTNYTAAVSQVKAADKYYQDVLRLYKEGLALFIELLDAQNQLVLAQLQANINLYDTWKKQAEIERATAGLIIK